MSGVRLLVGTRKGGFVLSSDGKRKKWKVSGQARMYLAEYSNGEGSSRLCQTS